MPSKIYSYDAPTTSWRSKGRSNISVSVASPEFDDTLYRPVSYASLAEARTALDAPTDANYVMWSHGSQTLETVFASLGANDILVLPERAEPYLIDSSNGFMAAGVQEIDGPNGTRTPIVSNSRLWFAMSRAQRGIIGLGPGAVISPSDSSFTAPAQPYPMTRYMTDGSTAQLVGCANKLIEAEHAYPFFANFTMTGRSFGGVSYNGIVSGDHTHTTAKRIHFDGSWRGFSGIPNGEAAGLGLSKGTYLIENCDFRSDEGPSPIMWNRNTGGVVRHVRTSIPNYGMFTFWRSGGVNTFENVWLNCNQIGMNLEENMAGFTLNWSGGKMMLNSTSNNKFHLNINPSNGSNKVTLNNVTVSPNGYTANRMCAHVYTTSGVQKRSDVSSNTLIPEYLPSSNWVA